MSGKIFDPNDAASLTTIRDYVEFGFQLLSDSQVVFGHGTDNAWDEAACLVFDTLNLPPDIPESEIDKPLSEQQRLALGNALHQRINLRKPLAYITNKTSFAGLDFYIDERALIPRSPIAELIENHFSPWLSTTPEKILDLCTGGGCIAIACAQHMPEAEITASDLSADALAVAEINSRKHQTMDRVTLVQSDLFAAIESGPFDVIVTNPPYVDAQDMHDLADEFRHEPEMALASGDDGLDIPRRILAEAANYLKHNGVLILEVGNSAPALEQAFPQLGMIWLEFSRGGEGICVIDKQELLNLAP